MKLNALIVRIYTHSVGLVKSFHCNRVVYRHEFTYACKLYFLLSLKFPVSTNLFIFYELDLVEGSCHKQK
mgnify:CR=1 FL=1